MLRNEKTGDGGIDLSGRLLVFFLFGVTLVFVGIAILMIAFSSLGGSGSAGGVILIGPIPIVFGVGSDSSWLVTFSIILTVVSVVLFLIMNRQTRRV